MILLYLSGLNMMEGMLTKEQWLRFPPKPNDAKLNEYGRRLHLNLTANADPISDYIIGRWGIWKALWYMACHCYPTPVFSRTLRVNDQAISLYLLSLQTTEHQSTRILGFVRLRLSIHQK